MAGMTTNAAWRYWNPTEILFGLDAVDGIGGKIGAGRYVLVTYDEPVFQAMTDRVIASAGKPAAVINGITTNPDYPVLEAACADYATARQAGPIDCIIALGGGSVIDAAKVLAAADGDFARVRRYLETGDGVADLTATPIIAVPTTAGTGSEVTCWATVWDSAAGKKHSLALPALYPRTAIVDPGLALGLPRALTVSTGLDALSHALESLWNVNANPVSASHAISAAKEILDVLPPLADDLQNSDLRTRLGKAATMAGLAFSNTKTALAHSLSYPITLHHGVAHGIACSFSLPTVMRWVAGADSDCDARLAAIFGQDLNAGADTLQAFLETLGVGTVPADHGVRAEEWRSLVEDALAGARGRNFLGDSAAVLADL